jgi:hypothetical protein
MAAPQKQARNAAQRSNSQRLARRVSAANQADWARTRVYELYMSITRFTRPSGRAEAR